MGDIADYLIDRMIEQGAWGGYTPEPPRCKHCGSRKVAWVRREGRWRLFTRDLKEPHRCVRVASADDFEDLTE